MRCIERLPRLCLMIVPREAIRGGLKTWTVLTILKKLTSSMSFAIFMSMSRVGMKWADGR